MEDVQNQIDQRNIPIDQVGIKNYKLPIFIPDKKNTKQSVVADICVTVNLDPKNRGTHMSRLIEIMEEYKREIFNYNMINLVLAEIKQQLDATVAQISIDFDYFIEKESPISKKNSLMAYQTSLLAELDQNNILDFKIAINVPVSSVCPCSKIISTKGAHNQRGLVNLNVSTDDFIYIEDLIEIIETKGGSSQIYSLLKRPDEKFLTEQMYDNPKFVEDIVRDLAVILNQDVRIKKYSVDCENFESIHNHNAYAKIISQKKV